MDREQIKKDRLRYTNNKISANLTYLAIVFDVLFFVSIYRSNVNTYYYNIKIGVSVLLNLVFLFLFCSIAAQMQKLEKGGEELAKGNLKNKVDTQESYSHI